MLQLQNIYDHCNQTLNDGNVTISDMNTFAVHPSLRVPLIFLHFFLCTWSPTLRHAAIDTNIVLCHWLQLV